MQPGESPIEVFTESESEDMHLYDISSWEIPVEGEEILDETDFDEPELGDFPDVPAWDFSDEPIEIEDFSNIGNIAEEDVEDFSGIGFIEGGEGVIDDEDIPGSFDLSGYADLIDW